MAAVRLRTRQLPLAVLAFATLAASSAACGDEAASDDGATGEAGAPSGSGVGGQVGGTSSSGGSSGQGGASEIDAGWSGPCPATLAERIRITALGTDFGFRENWSPAQLEPMADGGARLAVLQKEGVTVARLDAQEKLVGPRTTIPGKSVHGLVAHEDGAALLIHRLPDQMDLVRLSEDGSTQFEIPIVGANDHGNEGDKYVVTNHPHFGQLRWDGSQYAAYFGHSQNWGGQGEHQGDLLWLFNAAGERQPGGWDWGCSHSWSTRLLLHPSSKQLFAVCHSDAYPSPGIALDGTIPLLSGVAIPGDMAETPDGALIALTLSDPGGYQLAIMRVHADKSFDPPVVVVSSGDTAEMTPHLARYGDNYLLSWVAVAGATTFSPYNQYGPTKMALVDVNGNILLGPETVDFATSFYDDFITHSNGDLGWPVLPAMPVGPPESDGLEIARMRYCQ